MSRRIALVILLAIALPGLSRAADPTPAEMAAMLERPVSYRYTITVPALKKTATIHVDRTIKDRHGEIQQREDGTYVADAWLGGVIVPYVMNRAVVNGTDGPLRLSITVPINGEEQTYHYAAPTLADALYLVNIAPDRSWHEALIATIPESGFVHGVTGVDVRDIGELNAERKATALPPLDDRPEPKAMSDEAMQAMVRAAWDTHRTEVVAQISRSLLYYPAGKDTTWRITQKDGRLYAVFGNADRMFCSTITIRFAPGKDGTWQLEDIDASEVFKGE